MAGFFAIGERQLSACGVLRRRFSVGGNPTRQPLQLEAIGSVMEATEWLTPLV